MLPVPPSANRIWRYAYGRARPYLNPTYKAWIRLADGLMLANTPMGGWPRIRGAFRAEIVLDRGKVRKNADLDNRTKTIFDYLQRVGLIENDKHCAGFSVEWGSVSDGCRVRLVPA